MKGSPRVVQVLNGLLTLELTVVNQYFVHSKINESWGFARLAARLRATALEEMKDVEEIIERVLFLEGVPNLQRLGAVTLGESVPEQLGIQLEQERKALHLLAEGVKASLEEGDQASREFFGARLSEEEQHVDWLETQLQMIEVIGEPQYLAQQVRD